MADNTDEEHLDIPINTQSENPPDEITPTADTEAINPNQETENMEVHHHAHDPAAPHHKKNWKSYFWEFLMLFLAVTLGFFVENQREHYIEHKRAVVFAKSIIEDLKKDTVHLNSSIAYSFKKIAAIDSLTELMHSPFNTWDKTEFYKGVTLVFSTFPFAPTDGTYQQMKASGSLRYFDQSLVNLLNAYDNQLRSTVFRDMEEQKAAWELVPFAALQINFEVTGDLRFNKPITHETYIKMNDKTTIDIFINKVVTVRTMRGRSLEELQKQLNMAKNLIESINKEFHL